MPKTISPSNSCRLHGWMFLAAALTLLIVHPRNALAKRRLCGKILTLELRRVCTKPGTRGPCIHGQFSPPAKRRSIWPGMKGPRPRWHWHGLELGGPFEWAIRPAKSTPFLGQQPRASDFPSFFEQRRKRAGKIVGECCSGGGCDDEFLDSFCCDEEEQRAFRAIPN